MMALLFVLILTNLAKICHWTRGRMICYSNKDLRNQSTEFESENAYENMRGKNQDGKVMLY